MLVLECDTHGLRRDGLAGPGSIAQILVGLLPAARLQVIRTTTEAQLLKQLAELAARTARFPVVVIIGHSNAHGLQLTSDRFCLWTAVASWLAPFRPRSLIAVACEAGSVDPSDALFNGIGSLQCLYGAPVSTTLGGALFWTAVLSLARLRRITKSDLSAIRFAGVLSSGSVWYRQTRRRWRERPSWERLGADIAEELLRTYGRTPAGH